MAQGGCKKQGERNDLGRDTLRSRVSKEVSFEGHAMDYGKLRLMQTGSYRGAVAIRQAYRKRSTSGGLWGQ